MQRRVLPFLVLAIVFCAAVPAQALITVTFGNWSVPQGGSIEIPIAISTNAAEEISAVDLYVQSNGNVGPAPFATGIVLLDHPTLTDPIFSAVSSSTAPYGDPWDVFSGGSTGRMPAYAVFANAPSGAAADVPASGTLAYITFSAVGVPVGPYPVTFDNPDLGLTLMAKITGTLEAGVDFILNPGTITVTPEPSSVVLGLFAAASVVAVGVRRHRGRRAA